MTLSEISESVDALSFNTTVNSPGGLHKKRSSTMSPPHTTSWTPIDPYTHTHNYERPPKTVRRVSPSDPTATATATNQPWTNGEQEALYIAVERYKLYGQWAEVKHRMGLDRSELEIEQEYTRLYGELAGSDDEDWSSSNSDHIAPLTFTPMPGQTTPTTTTTSSTPGSRSSRETSNTQSNRHSQSTPKEQTHRSPYRRPVAYHPTIDGYNEDDHDDLRIDTEPSHLISRLPIEKNSGTIPASRNRPDPVVNADTKPTRTVRVWTAEQSDQLKSLIEDCFPGGYRINWVWVASQMGNTFTRKQCKNKWEIMRRRAGTEEEVALLKKGYDEFGPSWNKIQEKYLPERSQGGISIMWSLLQTREAEQQQQLERKQIIPRSNFDAAKATIKSPVSSRGITNDGVRPNTTPRAKNSGGSPTKKHRDASYQPRIMAQQPIGDDQEGHHRSPSDTEISDRNHFDRYPHNDTTSRETSHSPSWSREETTNFDRTKYSTEQYHDSKPHKRASVSSTESLSMSSQQEYQSSTHQHQQRNSDGSFEPWTERNRPMTWTEPLTRRLEDIIHQHFPNHQKVNWVKVSTLMGSNPVVTKEQCKRRWYLMSHYDHLRPRQSEISTAAYDSTSSTMAMDVDPLNAGSQYISGHAEAPHSMDLAYTSGPHYQKRSSEYVPWMDEEVELLKLGVERGRYCQLVMGPAGSGKSTYCSTIMTHCQNIGRPVHLVNLDPAAEKFEYEPSIDIKDLISLEDVMEELQYGPNGGLIYCMEFLMNNLDWLEDEVGSYTDDYLIIDCPGQIELYTHFDIMKRLVEALSRLNIAICGVYLLESQFVEDKSKFFAGVMSAMSAMINLEIPHINVMSKMDLLPKMKASVLERYYNPDPLLLLEDVNSKTSPKYHQLNQAIGQLVEDFNMVAFLPLNITDEDSITAILSHVDNAIQFGEDQEPKEPEEEGEAEMDDDY
ncbi:ATP binding protein [Entomortierella lignicola]|nr:ATP binding protein [Entomortierella lignicola]